MKRSQKQPYLKWIEEAFGSLENYIRDKYGPQALYDVIDDKFCLVHLDQPDESTRQRRCQEFREQLRQRSQDECPLCQMELEEGGFYIYDDCDGYCPECERKDTCEAYEEWEWAEEDPDWLERVTERVQQLIGDHEERDNNLWRNSYAYLDMLDEMDPFLALRVLAFCLCGHAIELREDLETLFFDEELTDKLYDYLITANRQVIRFLNTEGEESLPFETEILYKNVLSILDRIPYPQLQGKVNDLRWKITRVLELLEETLNIEEQEDFDDEEDF